MDFYKLYIPKKILKLARIIKSNIYYGIITRTRNFFQNKSKCSNLLIIAHPDDETIFFNKFLLKNNETFVICLTNGGNTTRAKEFWKALKYYGCKGNIMNNKDSLNLSFEGDKVIRQLRKYINKRNWKYVLTHNCEGEYGHIQHKSINEIVLKVFRDYTIMSSELNSGLFNADLKLSEIETHEKINMFKEIYKSQTMNILNPNDVFIKYFLYENIKVVSTGKRLHFES